MSWGKSVREDFLGYYERELSYLRHLGAEFGKRYPLVASRLKLDPSQCDDPHVERMLEAFAFLAARLHLRMDDEFPEITAALLGELYPYFLQPQPSISLVEFQPDPERGKATTGRLIPRGTPVLSHPSEGFVCRFRTCFDTELWPVSVAGASWRPGASLPPGMVSRQTAAAIELRISCLPDVHFESLRLNRLRFYLNGHNDLVYALYELLLTRCHSILIHDAAPGSAGKTLRLDPGSLAPVGFSAGQGLCWDPQRSFAGYQILQDYFAFPKKFLFLDLKGLEPLATSGISRHASIYFLLSPFEKTEWRSVLEAGISANTFKLSCTPIVNLFTTSADQIPLRQTVYELPVPLDSRMEVYSVDGVFGQSPSGDRKRYEPFINCQGERTPESNRFWNAMRRPSRYDENNTEIFVSILDRFGQPSDPEANSLSVKVTCTNRDLPHQLPMGNPDGDFQMEEHPEVQKIRCLLQPTQASAAPAAKISLWRLVSQLSLNHLSLVDDGLEALQCLLAIHNLSGGDSGKESIKGVLKVASRPHFARVSSQHGMAFVRGKLVEITVDEDRFTGNSAFLFGSVLEHFLGLYTSLNSFSQLVVRSRQRGDKPIHKWPPRAGTRVVV
jgi:type VI secretion system protein ImpG